MTTRTKTFKVGDHVILTQDREGFIKYIGTTSIGCGKWYGIELVNGNVGHHNGILMGNKYFECNDLRGIFVTKKEILRLFRAKDCHSSRREYRRESLRFIAENHANTKSRRVSQQALLQEQIIVDKYDEKNDKSHDKSKSKSKPNKKKSKKRVKIKLPAWCLNKSDNNNKKKNTKIKRKLQPTSKSLNGFISKNRNKKHKRKKKDKVSYEALRTTKKKLTKKSKSLHDFLVKKMKKNELKINKTKRYQSQSDLFDKTNNLITRQNSFLDEKILYKRDDSKAIIIHKPGPLEIGRNKYKGTTIKNNDDNESDILKEKLPKISRSVSTHKIRKAGPIEIGRVRSTNSTWKPIKYKIKINDTDFLSPRLNTGKKKKTSNCGDIKSSKYNRHLLKRKSKKWRKRRMEKKEIKFKEMEIKKCPTIYSRHSTASTVSELSTVHSSPIGYIPVNRYDITNKKKYDDNIKFDRTSKLLSDKEYRDLECKLDEMVNLFDKQDKIDNKLDDFDDQFKQLELRYHNSSQITPSMKKYSVEYEFEPMHICDYQSNSKQMPNNTELLNNHSSNSIDSSAYFSDFNGFSSSNTIHSNQHYKQYGSDGDINEFETYLDIDEDDEKALILYDDNKEIAEEHSVQKGACSIDMLTIDCFGTASSISEDKDSIVNSFRRSSLDMINVLDLNLSELIKDGHSSPTMEPIMESPDIKNIDNHNNNVFVLNHTKLNFNTCNKIKRLPKITKNDSIVAPGLVDVPEFLDYVGKWCIIFDDNKYIKYYYNIKKSGKVLITPKFSFGWKNKAHIVYDRFEKVFEITSTNMLNTDQMHRIKIDTNNKNIVSVVKYNMNDDALDIIKGTGSKINAANL